MSKCHFYVAHALPSFWQLIDAATIYIPTSIVHLKKSNQNPFCIEEKTLL